MKNSQGDLISGISGLKDLATEHFEGTYSNSFNHDLLRQLKVIKHFPRLFEENDCDMVGAAISLEEVRLTLNSLEKHKIPSPNGWTVEFYLHFFDMLGPVLTEAVNETRHTGSFPGLLNATFITLIPKKDKLISFHD